jgi:hypothetical protein
MPLHAIRTQCLPGARFFAGHRAVIEWLGPDEGDPPVVHEVVVQEMRALDLSKPAQKSSAVSSM